MSMKPKSLSDELWREYTWQIEPGIERTVRIDNPVALFVGNTTHRILTESGGVVCVPTVGERGCVLSWMPRFGAQPVAF